MNGTKEQGGKSITEEDVVRIKPYKDYYCVAISFASCKFDKKEARDVYDAYTAALPVENAEGATLSEQEAATFFRITGLSAPRINEIVRQKWEELRAQYLAQANSCSFEHNSV